MPAECKFMIGDIIYAPRLPKTRVKEVMSRHCQWSRLSVHTDNAGHLRFSGRALQAFLCQTKSLPAKARGTVRGIYGGRTGLMAADGALGGPNKAPQGLNFTGVYPLPA